MLKAINNFLERDLPVWVMDICYAALLIEALGVVIIYFRFDILVELVELLI